MKLSCNVVCTDVNEKQTEKNRSIRSRCVLNSTMNRNIYFIKPSDRWRYCCHCILQAILIRVNFACYDLAADYASETIIRDIISKYSFNSTRFDEIAKKAPVFEKRYFSGKRISTIINYLCYRWKNGVIIVLLKWQLSHAIGLNNGRYLKISRLSKRFVIIIIILEVNDKSTAISVISH